MYKLCVFAGTTEGREIIQFLTEQPVTVHACVATDYGETLLPHGDALTVSARRLTEEEMEELFRNEAFDLVIDATHPYAPVVTENISAACRKTGTEYLRLLREENELPEGAVFASDAEEAAAYLDGTEGNVLLTTGSKKSPNTRRCAALPSGFMPGSCPWRILLQPVKPQDLPPHISSPCRGRFPKK